MTACLPRPVKTGLMVDTTKVESSCHGYRCVKSVGLTSVSTELLQPVCLNEKLPGLKFSSSRIYFIPRDLLDSTIHSLCEKETLHL